MRLAKPIYQFPWFKISTSVVLIVIIQCIIAFSDNIERWYTSGLYVFISRLLRMCFGWMTSSMGDIFYVGLILYFLTRFIRFLIGLFKREMSWKLLGIGLVRLFLVVGTIYIVFYFFWGLNYYRKGIAYQLKIEKQEYSTAELYNLTKELAEKSSAYRKEFQKEATFALPQKTLFADAVSAYDSVKEVYPFLSYKTKSVKASMFGGLGNYMGYTGYYNPFSGEAQVNMNTPAIVLPAVVCHEMAHQLGYATEDEANFVGYLAASHSNNKVFLYSTYLDLYQYAATELFLRDSSQYIVAKQSLDTLVRKDIQDVRKFYLPYRTRMRSIINVVYGQYLKANNQPQGIETYSDVISLLMAYRKKYGKI